MDLIIGEGFTQQSSGLFATRRNEKETIAPLLPRKARPVQHPNCEDFIAAIRLFLNDRIEATATPVGYICNNSNNRSFRHYVRTSYRLQSPRAPVECIRRAAAQPGVLAASSRRCSSPVFRRAGARRAHSRQSPVAALPDSKSPFQKALAGHFGRLTDRVKPVRLGTLRA
jgi:hypothetical protein